MSHKFKTLGTVIDRDAYDWLLDTYPDIAAALESEVLAGATPEDVRRFMIAQVGEHRTGLIARVVSASRWLQGRA